MSKRRVYSGKIATALLAVTVGIAVQVQPAVAAHHERKERSSHTKHSQHHRSSNHRSIVEPVKIAALEPFESTGEMDTALISVMRDINKALKASEEAGKLEDPAQRAALKAATEAIDASLSKTAVEPNRIVPTKAKERYEKSLIPESWESGNLDLSDGSHASLNVLWAKKVNGLLNISVAGNCGCKPNAAGDKAGEFVVVINGKSTLDSGFDIQSQSDVNFWLGKLGTFNVDATTCSETQARSDTTVPILKALLKRPAQVVPVSEAGQMPVLPGTAATEAGKMPALPGPAAIEAGKMPAPAEEKPALVTAEPEAPTEKKPSSAGDVTVKTEVPSALVLAPATPDAKREPVTETPRLPSETARIVAPKQAIAGDYITVSVLNKQDKAEPFVELTFNDYKSTTNADGKLVYQVPEDALPGPSVSIAFPARPQTPASTIDVLQPLMRPLETDMPRIDRVSFHKGNQNTLLIEGHNFDGIAEHNRVSIDGSSEAPVLVASPVQLRAVLTHSLTSGNHSVSVERNGLKSEPISCSVPAQQPEVIVSKTRKKS